jgi:diacylglycerol O-acyltransferase
MTIDRASATDLAFLAMDRGRVPEQIAAILVLAPGASFDLTGAQRLLAERIAAVPRLRQRLVHLPPGCGRPVWVDDAGFDIRRHVRCVPCRYPGDEQALLDTAAAMVTQRLPRSRPLWSAVFVTGLAGGAVALLVVLHHVLADGIGGLAVLATLADGVAGSEAATGFPRPPPSHRQLAADAMRDRLRALSRTPVAWRELRRSMSAGGGWTPPRVTPCSLNQRTGPRRRLVAVHADLIALRAGAHRAGGTVNDALLTAVGGALGRVLAGRGEPVDALAVAVPVAARRSTRPGRLGNEVAPMVVDVPVTGDPVRRLGKVHDAVCAHREEATGPAPIAVLGPVFRAMAALGGYRWYMNHQHRLHALVSYVRGPERPLAFAGATVTRVVPVAVAEAGNVTVSFVALSYAGTLTITAVADPDHFPDLAGLVKGVRTELALLTSAPVAEV